MSPLDGNSFDLERRIERLSQLADVLRRCNMSDGGLRSTIADLQRQVRSGRRVAATDGALMDAVLADVDLYVGRMGSRDFIACHPHKAALAGDFREVSRLCREEARAHREMAVRRALAARALELALLGERAAWADAQ